MYKPLEEFFEKHADVDIFCLQEVFNGVRNFGRPAAKEAVGDIFERISNLLPEHQGFYCDEQEGEEGEAIFVRKSLGVERADQEYVHRWKNAMRSEDDGRMLGRALQYIRFRWAGRYYTVAHVHGLWNGQGKGDSPDRIKQSQKIKALLDDLDGPKVLTGDLNLLPDTQSMRILDDGMKNLVREYGIMGTRSSLYANAEKYADYILTSDEIEVVDFCVLQETVSDHLPLYLEFR